MGESTQQKPRRAKSWHGLIPFTVFVWGFGLAAVVMAIVNRSEPGMAAVYFLVGVANLAGGVVFGQQILAHWKQDRDAAGSRGESTP